jgi:hypothetical protein
MKRSQITDLRDSIVITPLDLIVADSVPANSLKVIWLTPTDVPRN